MAAIDKLDKHELNKNDGPCVKKLDEVLNMLNVQRQAYHGRSFVGNHVHKMLKVIFSFNKFIGKAILLNHCEDIKYQDVL
jgi:hypothetical protein